MIITVVAGTVFLMWMGEQLTEHGVGNGISLIIFFGILDRLPYSLKSEWAEFAAGTRSIFVEILLLAFMVAVIAFVVELTQGQRRIRVQYPKKVVGRKIYGGQSTYIPLRVNTAGVIAIIFAQAIMFVPQTVATLVPWTFFQNTPPRPLRRSCWTGAKGCGTGSGGISCAAWRMSASCCCSPT